MATTTAPVPSPPLVHTYVQTSHLHHDMTVDGVVVAHRYQHVVTGMHHVRRVAPGAVLGTVVVNTYDKVVADRAWVALYREHVAAHAAAVQSAAQSTAA